ncbi:hypothetical protein ANCCEY_14426 [Ancylostoma ceylanicum]|uniref:Uncharacterized protein n=1 Tax=Ancylostoma ceylanicum TaxID=53326 RepID=A0A0D6L9V8_9BILA|nr:hypothetical protein ANCCEY_14426 [Ancylostoma ceylanicum]
MKRKIRNGWLWVLSSPSSTPHYLKVILGMEKNMADMYADPAGLTAEMEQIFKGKTRDEWVALFEGKNACVSPVLDLDEAVEYRHNLERRNFTRDGDKSFPQPAPRMYTKEEFRKLMSKL